MQLRDQVFLSHTGADRQLGSVSLTSAIYQELKQQQLAAFYDTHTLQQGDLWRDKIQRCVRSSKVLVVVLSPSYFDRCVCCACISRQRVSRWMHSLLLLLPVCSCCDTSSENHWCTDATGQGSLLHVLLSLVIHLA